LTRHTSATPGRSRSSIPRLVPFIRAAVTGLCPTSDRGKQQFVIDVSGCGLFNVDTEELIWPWSLTATVNEDVPMRVLTDPELWERTSRHWDEEHPRQWVAFVWRVPVPLANRLKLNAPPWS
jgi:hypothetical protein